MNLPPDLLQSQQQSPGQGMGGMQQGQEEKPEQILAHFKPEELSDMDEMQGGISIDPETGLREYSKLSQVMQDPQIREALIQGMQQQGGQEQGMQQQGQMPQHYAFGGQVQPMGGMQQPWMQQPMGGGMQYGMGGMPQQPGMPQQYAEGGQVEPGRPQLPELEQIRMQGEHGDTELAIITPELFEMFKEINDGNVDQNPHTGLPQFGKLGGFLKGAVRIIAPIIGGYFGGPVGAALAGGLATKLTGGTTKQALTAGAMSGVGSALLSGAGGMFGAAAKGGVGAGSGAGGGFLSGLFGGGAKAAAPALAGQVAGNVGSQVAAPAAGGMFSGLMSGMGKHALPMAIASSMLMKGNAQERGDIARFDAERKAADEKERQRLGIGVGFDFSEPLPEYEPNEQDYNKEHQGERSYFRPKRNPRQRRAQGGPVHALGGGRLKKIISRVADPFGLTKTKYGDVLGLTKNKTFDVLNLLGNVEKKPKGQTSVGNPVANASAVASQQAGKPSQRTVMKLDPHISTEEMQKGLEHLFFRPGPSERGKPISKGSIMEELEVSHPDIGGEESRRPERRSSGGGVFGKGKGQQDLIKKDLPNNTYIIDASTVSDIGDGSTRAGVRELDNYFSKFGPMKRSKGGNVKALLSDGEYEVSPHCVAALGQGSFDKGSKILDSMVKKVRVQKRSKGAKFPAKAKSVGGYISKMQRAC
jgi:hypothetical protein